MIGLEPEDRTASPHDAQGAHDAAHAPKPDEIDDAWDDEDYEDWLFL